MKEIEQPNVNLFASQHLDVAKYFMYRCQKLGHSICANLESVKVEDIDKFIISNGYKKIHTSHILEILTRTQTFSYIYEHKELNRFIELQGNENAENSPQDGDDDDDISIKIVCENFEDIDSIKKDFRKYFDVKINTKNKIYLVCKDMGFYLEEKQINLKFNIDDIEMNYGQAFKVVDDKIKTEINKKNNHGLILLHGLPGTGKTSYIKYLLGKVTNKKIIYIPPYMAESLSSPEFLPFIMSQKNSIIVIEDAEQALMAREQKENSAASTLLNISDGILGECIQTVIICTFNTQMDKIDSALLRKGRLLAKHEFKKLSLEDAKRLATHLKLDESKITEEMTLADIFNLNSENFYKKEEKQEIGFGFGFKTK